MRGSAETGARRGEAAAGCRDCARSAIPLISALGHTLRWRVEGLEHFDAIVASGRQPVMAFWHGRILPATYYFRRRGIVVITSENFDGEWIAADHRAVRLRHGARIDVARRRARRCCSSCATWRRASPRASRSTARAVRRASRSRAPCGWRRRPAIPSCRFTSRRRRHWTRAQLGSDADPEAVQHRGARGRRADRGGEGNEGRRARSRAGRPRAPTCLTRTACSRATRNVGRRPGRLAWPGAPARTTPRSPRPPESRPPTPSSPDRARRHRTGASPSVGSGRSPRRRRWRARSG